MVVRTGIPVARTRILTFTLAGVFYAIGGVLAAAQLGLGNAQIGSGTAEYVAVQVGADVIVFADSRNDDGVADDAVVLAGRTLADIDLSRPIGSQFDYSNLGVGLLGHALANAAKAEQHQAPCRRFRNRADGRGGTRDLV